MRSCSRADLIAVFSVLLAGFAGVSSSVLAVDTTDVPSAENQSALDEIEAVGHATFSTGDVVAEEFTGSSSHIPRTTLETTSNALGEVLAREMGVQNRQSGGFGSFSSISIRSASGAQTAVYLDGVLLNNSASPVLDFSTLELLNLESIDIYRGSTPLQLGHAGIGGAVNLKTLGSGSSDSDLPATKIRLGIGSFNQQDIQISHQGSYGQWTVITALTNRRSDNDFSFTNNNATPQNLDDDRREKRNNAKISRKSVLLSTSYRFSPDRRTNLSVQATARDSGVPNARNSANTIASFDTETTQFQLSQVVDDFFSWNTRHTLYLNKDRAHFLDPLSQIGLGSQDATNDTQVSGLITYWEYLLDSGTLGVSADWRREKLDSFDVLGIDRDFSAQRKSLQANLHYVWMDFSEKWTVSPAVRWNTHSLNANASDSRATEFDDRKDSNTGAQLGIGYQLNDRTLVRVNMGSYYREPSFGELYASYGLVNGSPNLVPEEGFNIDANIIFTHTKGAIEASVFNSTRKELIVTAFDSRGIGRPTNNGKARIQGVELAGQLILSDRFSIRSNLTWQDPRSTDESTGFRNKFLPGEARLASYSRLQYQYQNIALWYELNTKRKLFYDSVNILPAPDVEQHSIGANWKNQYWQLNFSVNNLSNQNVQDFNGFPKPGRSFHLAATRRL
ncbi:MAG: TonB-dependent receptor plug domain-containing protein [Granulosicoccus sp.]